MIQRIVALLGSLVLLLVVVAFLNTPGWSLQSYGGGGSAGGTGGAGGTGAAGGTGGTGGTGATGTAGGTGGTGAAASATASPAPTFVVSRGFISPGSAPTFAIPTGGATPVQAGDCMVLQTEANGGAGTAGLTQASANNLRWANLSIGETWATNRDYWPYFRIVSPADITSPTLTFTGIGSGYGVCAAFFRHVTCSSDGLSTFATNTTNSPQPGSITTTLDGDMAVSMGMLNSGSTGTYSAPAGYTNAIFVAPVNGVGAGCYIDFKLLGAAGATQPGVGVGGSLNAWGAKQIALPNLGGTQ